MFFDPNKLAEDGTISLATFAFSKDGKTFAYATASGGSDWNEYFVMEVASLAYKYERLYGLKFKGAILTNFSSCHHIPMHGSFEQYKQAKQRLFSSLDTEALAVLPCDDKYFEDFKKVTKAKIITFGFSEEADVSGEIIKEKTGLICRVKSIKGEFILQLKRDSVFNYKNALAATALSLGLGINLDSIKQGLEAIKVWCKAKGIPEEAAYPIFAKILGAGINPQPFLYPAYHLSLIHI